MNDPDEHDDDPDGVTLWSGRLRPWPVAPGPDGNEDDTVGIRRTTPGGDTASSREAERDETASSSPPSPDVDTAPSSPPSPDVDTAPSSLDDVAPPSWPDADTAPSRSRRPPAGSGRSLPGDTPTIPAAIDDSLSASVVDTSTVPRAGVEQRLSASVADTEADARPRGIRRPVPVADGEPPGERQARSPVALHRESYAPRVDEPARVARASTGGTARSGDAAVVHPRRSPGRARLVVLTAAIIVVVVLAALGVALLLG